jgi:DNA-directed RNA polymerase specialized sigma24 family protein
MNDIALPGGEGAKDLASSTLLKFLDPLDQSVTWSAIQGEPTTSGVIAYLREVLRRDFLDIVRSKRARTTVYVDSYESNDGEVRADMDGNALITEATPELIVLERERLDGLLSHFSSEPTLYELLHLQCEPHGYNGFTNQELAQILGTSVRDIEKRKKRIKVRLKKIAGAAVRKEAQHA